MKNLVTFVSSINFWLADKCRRVYLVAAKEHITWVSIAAAYVTLHVGTATPVMTFKCLSVVAEEKLNFG